MKIAIANDHAAVELKNKIMEYVKELGHEVINYGTDSLERCNYPEFGEKAARAVAGKEVKGIRAAVCSEPVTARLVKEHNNANIIAFGARIVGEETAREIVKAYLEAVFLGGRHKMRVDMIAQMEERF